MEMTNMKNIVVLKNLPSNIVEEAFVIVKPNLKIKEKNRMNKDGKIETKKINAKDYVIKEAESVVCNYISHIENTKKSKIGSKLEKKYKNLKRWTSLVSLLLLISLVVNFMK